jgi:RNA polymerase sigma-70 factor (ECF subfamily)
MVTGRHHISRQFEHSSKRMHCIAMSWGCEPDLARDLVQETFLIALDKYDQLRDTSSLENWLISILANCHKGYIRKSKMTQSLDSADELISIDNPDSLLEQQHITARVQLAISQLNDDQRKVLTLVDMEGMSYQEVASILDIKIGTVMSRLSRARKRLKGFLKDTLLHADQQQTSCRPVRSIK